ncbi:unnamed protein product, partial [Larinioides sclopetarius]
MFCCSYCAKDFSHVHLYLSHLRNFHRYDPHFNYICGFNNCPMTFTTFSSFRKHLYQHNEFKTKNENILTCRTCGYKSFLKSKFILHFKEHDIIFCPLKNCQAKYTVYSSFKSHLSRYHPCFVLNDLKSKILTPVESRNQAQ